MTDRVPTRAQCLRAAARLPTQLISDREGVKRWRVYSFSMCKPFCRVIDITARNNTSGNTDVAFAGALLIAADESVRDMTAALRRASQIEGDWLDMPDAPTFSAVVASRALLLLRNGWRRNLTDEQRHAAEVNAEVEAHLRPVPYRDDTDEADAAWAAQNNAAWA